MKELQKHEAKDVEESEVKLGNVTRFALGLSGLTFAGGCGDEDTPNRDSETSNPGALAALLDGAASQSIVDELTRLTDLPDLQLVWVSTRQLVELQKSLPNETIPASLAYIYDEDGETWRSIGSKYLCLTCVYDDNGILRFRGHGYASAESIGEAVTIVGEAR